MTPWVARALRSHVLYLVLVAAAVSIVAAVGNPLYLRWGNWMSILKQISVPGLLAVGATILIISGNFDISVGANVGLSACTMAVLVQMGHPMPLVVLVGMAVAVSAATFVGLASILLRAPSFIVSLACIGLFSGISRTITDFTRQNVKGQFQLLSGAPWGGVLPPLFAVSLAGYAVAHLMLTYTRLGRRVYAIGNNPRAAYLSGIAVARNRLMFHAINGLYVGLAAMLWLSWVGGADADSGKGMELSAIGAAVIGGAAMGGGKGNVVGTFLAVLLVGMIEKALNLLHVPQKYQTSAFGLLILLALAIGSLNRRSKDVGARLG